MAIIQISDELHDKLMAMAMAMALQDNRSTASPNFYQVRQPVRIYGIDPQWDYDGRILIPDDGGEAIEIDRDSLISELEVLGVDINFKKRSDSELMELLIQDHNYTEGYYRNEYVFTNAFLTERTCRDHIERNRHNYTDPVDYLSYAERNPDLETITEFFKELAGHLVNGQPADCVFDQISAYV